MKFRFVLFLIMIVLFTILVVQNSKPADILIFWWPFNVSLSLLTVTTGIVGIILGFIFSKLIDSRKHKIEKEINNEKNISEIKQDNPDIPDVE